MGGVVWVELMGGVVGVGLMGGVVWRVRFFGWCRWGSFSIVVGLRLYCLSG